MYLLLITLHEGTCHRKFTRKYVKCVKSRLCFGDRWPREVVHRLVSAWRGISVLLKAVTYTHKQGSRSSLKEKKKVSLWVLTKTTSKESQSEGCGLCALSPQVVLERKVVNLFSSDTYFNRLISINNNSSIFCHGRGNSAHTTSPILWLFMQKPVFQGMYIFWA